jgi:hypothetical protein
VTIRPTRPLPSGQLKRQELVKFGQAVRHHRLQQALSASQGTQWHPAAATYMQTRDLAQATSSYTFVLLIRSRSATRRFEVGAPHPCRILRCVARLGSLPSVLRLHDLHDNTSAAKLPSHEERT